VNNGELRKVVWKFDNLHHTQGLPFQARLYVMLNSLTERANMSWSESGGKRDGIDPGGSDSGERRYATVLFADLVGFTAFSEHHGEEAAYSLMRRLLDVMTDAVRRHGGTVKSFTGDGLMALFGVPIAFEDAAMRACRASLDIQNRVALDAPDIEAKFGLRPQMRIALNTGPIITDGVKSGEDTGINAIGDTVNLAARLQTLAEPGAVVLSEATYRLVRGLVEVHPVGEHEIKGKSERQRIYRLNGVRHSAMRFDRSVSIGLTAYVGRSRELEALERAFESRRQGIRVVEIVGEPGIGKSRLIHEFRERIGDQRAFVLLGSCNSDGQQVPFLPLIDIVRGSFRVSEGEVESAIARKLDKGLSLLGLSSEQNLGLLLHLLGLKAPEGVLKGLDGVLIGLRTRDLLLRLLQERCRLTPVIMLLEDLHWIDKVSQEVLGHIIASEEDASLLIVQTCRPEYKAPWQGHSRVATLKLEPLTTAETSQIVRYRLGVDDLPVEIAKLVTDKAEGNPLFAEEIVSFLIERGVVQRATKGIDNLSAAAALLPASIQSLLSARVDRLNLADRSLAQAASVIGRRFSRDLLASVTHSDDIDARLSAIHALDIIYPDVISGEFVFKHALVRDALYTSLLQQPRSALHLAIATEIEQRSGNRLTEVAEALALHYGETECAEKWYLYLVMAGEKSLGVYSLGEAEQYFQRALSLVEEKPKCTDDAGFINLLTDVAHLLSMTSEPVRTARLIERHRPRIESLGDSPQSVIVLTYGCFAAFSMSRFRAGFEAAKQLMAMALRLDDDRSKAYARAALVYANSVLAESDPEEIERYAEMGINEADRTEDAYLRALTRVSGAWHFFCRGLTERGRQLAVELQTRGRARGDPESAALGEWILGLLDNIDERYADALVHADECIRVSLTPLDREVGFLVKGFALVVSGNVSEGMKLLVEHRQRALASEFIFPRALTDPAVALGMVLEGDFSGGVRFLERSIEDQSKFEANTSRDFSRILLAEIYIGLLVPKTRAPILIVLRNLPFLVKTSLTGRKRAIALLLEARLNPMFSEVGYHRARIDADLAILYKLAKRTHEADNYFRQARVVAEKLGAKGLLAKIDAASAST
jgi:class 3 adenylate cyclase/tetratricopeptide (TPR) repeat protein